MIGGCGRVTLDLERGRRLGFPEVVYGEGKDDEALVEAVSGLVKALGAAMVTRCDERRARLLLERFPSGRWLPLPRVFVVGGHEAEASYGRVGVVCAGTSDTPAAEEAAAFLEFCGVEVARIYDVGVAGIHRLLERLGELDECDVLIVAAGMEGALPSVVGGLCAAPLVALPTSVGYGAGAGGIAALLAMLNSCASGVTVVNVDNGFGAGVAAFRILRAIARAKAGAGVPECRPSHPSAEGGGGAWDAGGGRPGKDERKAE